MLVFDLTETGGVEVAEVVEEMVVAVEEGRGSLAAALRLGAIVMVVVVREAGRRRNCGGVVVLKTRSLRSDRRITVLANTGVFGFTLVCLNRGVLRDGFNDIYHTSP